jgi:small-conductance mechanosensitive channel
MIIRIKLLILALLLCSLVTGISQDSLIANHETNKLNEIQRSYVILEGDTLFEISQSIGAFSPADRVEAITHRLNKLVKTLTEVEDSFYISDLDGFSFVKYKDITLMSISEKDAKHEGHPRAYLAENYKEIMHISIKSHILDYNLKGWLKRIGFTLLLLIGLILYIILLNKFFKWLNKKLILYEQKLKFKRLNLFRYLAPKGPKHFFVFVSNVIRFILILLFLFLYLPLLFSFLPWTQHIVQKFYGYIADPIKYILNGLLDFLPNLFFIIIIFYAARYIVRILSHISQEVEDDKLRIHGFHKDWAKPTVNILKIVIYAFALIFIFPYLPGSDSPAFQGVSIFLGVLLSLGSTSAIANIVAGVVITYMRPFQIGDRVRINQTIGDVTEKSLLVTKIKTLKNEDVTIPNATIINTHLWNYSKNAEKLGLVLYTSITIGYDVPWNTVNKLLIKAAERTPLVLKDPPPFVLQKNLDDYYVNYEINIYTKNPESMAITYSELHKNILEEFYKAGVEILSPRYVATRDGSDAAIPDQDNFDSRNPVEKIIDKATNKKE